MDLVLLFVYTGVPGVTFGSALGKAAEAYGLSGRVGLSVMLSLPAVLGLLVKRGLPIDLGDPKLCAAAAIVGHASKLRMPRVTGPDLVVLKN